MMVGQGLWERPLWQVLLAMAAGNTLIAAVLWLAAPRDFSDYWVVSNCVGYGVCLAQRAWVRLVGSGRWLPLAVLGGTIMGAPAGLWLASVVGSPGLQEFLHAHQAQTLRYTAVGIVFGIAFGLLWHSLSRVRELEAREREATLRQAEQDKQALAAHLRLLQAQIEPHFLFNTLANLHSLIEQQPALARHLLEQITDYLRVSLVHSRAERSTLGDETRLLGAYLEIQAIRMGGRLQYRLEVAPELQTLVLPPMLLQPLVENAVCHGIEPCVDGGEVVVRADRRPDALVLQVCDTGLGFGQSGTGGQGVGLVNVRERLATLYGSAARLDILQHTPRGVCVEIWISDSAF